MKGAGPAAAWWKCLRAAVADEDAQRGRAFAGHQRIAGRRADGLVRKSALEQHPACGQPVNIRRLHPRVAAAAQQGLEVVHADEQDVEPACRWSALILPHGGRGQRRQQQGGAA